MGQVAPAPPEPAGAEATIGPSTDEASSALQRGQRTASPGRTSGNRTRAPHWHETTAGIDGQSLHTGKSLQVTRDPSRRERDTSWPADPRDGPCSPASRPSLATPRPRGSPSD